MGDAYRDDLDAALLRSAALERENEQLRARNAELERRFARPPAVSEAERDRQRLHDALAREREEASARARAREDDARLRALAKSYKARGHDESRSVVLTLGLLGVVIAGAAGSAAGIAVVIGVAGALLALVSPAEEN